MNAPARLDRPSAIERQALPDWPRLMREAMAAAYVGISGPMLREHGPKPKHIGRCAVWDRHDLDRWADAIGGQPLDPRQREEEGAGILDRVQGRLNGKN